MKLRRLAAFAILLAACRAVVAPPAEHAELLPPPVLDAGTLVTPPITDPADPSISPTYEAMLDERDRLLDWRSTIFGSRASNPPDPLRAHALPKTGGLTYGKVARINAYRFSKAPFGSAVKQEEMPYAKDGSLDPHVILPEVVLDDRERDDVLSGLRDVEAQRTHPHPKGTSLRCGFDAHHAFVFFDVKGSPIGKLIVAFRCGEFQFTPSTKQFGDVPQWMPSTALIRTLSEISDRHGLGAWIEAPYESSFEAYRLRRYGHSSAPTELGRARLERAHAKPTGVDPSRMVDQATPDDRQRFCVWLRDEIETRGREAPGGRITGGFACDDGGAPQWAFRTEPPLDNCEKKLACNVPFSKIERCLRTTFLRIDSAEGICRDGTPECAGVLDCLPFLDRGTLR